MRGRFHKRRNRRTWFPVEGQDAGQEGGLPAGEFWAFQSGSTTCVGGDPINYRGSEIVGLTFDVPPEEIPDGSTSLADWQGSAWQLGGIVGKFHASIRPDADATHLSLFQTVLIMAWFAVLQVDDGGSPRETDLRKYDPMLASNIREPYVWRRSWILQQPAKDTPGTTIVTAQWPQSTAEYGSVMDGPHIDAKSGRFIGQNERLFFGLNAVPLADTGAGFQPEVIASSIAVDWLLDYRLLGVLRKASNKRSTSL